MSYVEHLMPPTVISRPVAGEVPTIDLAIGYAKTNDSPILKLLLSRVDELVSSSTKANRTAAAVAQPRSLPSAP